MSLFVDTSVWYAAADAGDRGNERAQQILATGESLVTTYSLRTFIVGPDDNLYRLATAKFSRMLNDPENHRLERFAGQRVRMIEAVVEIRDRIPCRVARILYEMLGFDAEGRLDRRALMRQNAAIAAAVMANLSMGESPDKDATVVDASSRFVARGSRWQPTPSLEQRILRVVLAEVKCKRL